MNRLTYVVLISAYLILLLVSCYPYVKITRNYVETEFPIINGFELFIGDTDLMVNDSISIQECKRILCVPTHYKDRFISGEFQSQDEYWIAVFREDEKDKSIDTIDWGKVVYLNQVNENHIWVTMNFDLGMWEVHNKFPIDLSNEMFYGFRLLDLELDLATLVIFTYSDEKEKFVKDHDSASRIRFY